MGRLRRYRERIQFEMSSVRAKNVGALLARTLQSDYGCSRLEAAVLAERSVQWLGELGVRQLPGQVWLSVPSSPSRRYAQSQRRVVRVTAVDMGEDTEVWETYGLATMQRRRLLRWIGEIHRQGGWASLAELAAWANLTPTALAARLRPMRQLGVWLPHVAGAAANGDELGLEAWLVERYLLEGKVEGWRRLFGLTVASWEGILRRFVGAVDGFERGEALEAIADHVGRSPREVKHFVTVAKSHRRKGALRELRAVYGSCSQPESSEAGIETELQGQYGFSRVAARLYDQQLRELAGRVGAQHLHEGEMIFFAIDAEEGPRAKLPEARHVAVKLSYFNHDDAARGPRSASPTRVAELKFARLLRYC